ncbi:MAG TPA: Crp/Fnr family transcriptional regulator [Chitinophagaceae bacterium]|nr:Crp/Fnr family transcriptional regulator [Chitinophagaceae bacterium]
MKIYSKLTSLFIVVVLLGTLSMRPSEKKILIFFETKGYYHESIPTGVAAIQLMGQQNGFAVDTSRTSEIFTDEKLSIYDAVLFMSTTKDVLNEEEQNAFKRFIQKGKGFVGIHAATDTEYEWPWFNQLVGAYFKSHPKQQDAVLHIKDSKHPATKHLPKTWKRWDEWYNFKDIQPDLKVLITLDESSYTGGENGSNHPISWYHSFDGGRAFYTGLGHTHEAYSDPLFLKHVLGGINYAMGKK